VPLMPALEAHRSERRDVIKGRGAKRSDPTVPACAYPSAGRSADDHRRGTLWPGAAPRDDLHNRLVDIGTTNRDCALARLRAKRTA
jgi:hypothetical protein